MAFNPDDFQFESISPPEELKPILEWNSIARLLVVRVRSGETKEWEYFASKLNPTVNDNLLKNFPDRWSNDNDRIINFAIYEDGEYILEKEKMKFDFETKKTKWIRYQYNDLEYTEVKEIFEVLKAAIELNRVDQEVVRTREIIDLAKSAEYILQVDNHIKRTKEILLNQSAWSQLADATETFEGEIELWRQYRAWLRDNVKTPEDFDDILDYLIWDTNFKWPADPISYHKNDPEHFNEYLSIPEHFSESVTGTGSFATEALYGNIQRAALVYQEKLNNGGVPITKKIWDKIESYKLYEGLNGANLENLSIVEE